MKKLISGILISSVIFSANLLHAQEVPDSIVQMTAQSEGLSLVSVADAPEEGTFWLVMSNGIVPEPAPLFDPSLLIYAITTNGQFLVDDTDGQVAVDTGESVEDALAALAVDVTNLINQIQNPPPVSRSLAMRAMHLDFTPDFDFSTNGLYLQINAVSNGLAYLTLNNGTDEVYAIWGTTNLALPVADWQVMTELWPTNGTTNTLPFTVNAGDYTNLFLLAQDWTDVTANENETPLWWLYYWFGTAGLSLSDGTLDSSGNSLLSDYENGLDPNVILFSLQFTNQYISTSTTYGGVTIDAGIPSYVAVLLNDTNTSDAVWQPYSSTNVPVNFSYGNGTYTVGVGLKGLAPDAQQTWLWDNVTYFNPSAVPLILIVTNPAISTVSVPMIQLQGYVSKSLSSLTYDVSNASGEITNQPGYWQPAFYDTNVLQFTTNSFQCYDVPLANGVNAITLHATDTASNTITTNFNYTLDYSGVTNGPALTLVWPTNEAEISIGEISSDGMEGGSDTFTLKAKVDDPTATVGASIADAYGDMDSAQGLVERDGTVWVNLPVEDVTNTITLSATNAAGYVSQSTSTVYESDATVVVLPLVDNELNQSSVSVTGLVSDASDSITVNGVDATVNPDGVWNADGVAVNAAGTAELAVAVTDGSGNPVTSEVSYQAQPVAVMPSAYTILLRSLSWGYNSWCSGTGPEVFNDDTEHWVSGNGSDYELFTSWDGECGDPVDGDSITTDLSGYVDDLPMPLENINANLTDPAGGTTRLNIQTTLAIQPSGQKPAGTMATYLVMVSALEYAMNGPEDPIYLWAYTVSGNILELNSLTETPVTPEQLQVNGQTVTDTGIANANGSTWGLVAVSGPSGAPVTLKPSATLSNPNDDATFQAKVAEFGLTVVSNSAVQIGTTTNWAVVKGTNGYVTVQATLSDTNLIPLLTWTGGQAVTNNPLQRQVSATNSAETTVTASIGGTNLSLNVWVIWANLTVKTSGTLDPDDKAAVLNNGDFPTPNTTYGSFGLGGGNTLGPIDRFTNTNLNYSYTIGKMEAKATLQPTGIGNILSSTNNWNLKRIVIAIAWDNGSLTYTTGGTNPPSGQDDTGGNYFKYLNPTNEDIFDLDWPGCPILSGQTPNHTSEVYDNFYEYVTINLGNGDQLCSATNTYSYTAQIDFDLTTNNVQLNSLSTSLIALPTNSIYTPR